MPVAIRLSRVGTKHVPFFRVVVVDSRKKRDGAVLENLGTYDALNSKLVLFKPERYDAWVLQGAQPTDSAKKVYKIFKKQESGALKEKAEKPKVKKAKAAPQEKVEATKKDEQVKAKPDEVKVEKAKEPSVEESSTQSETEKK